MILISAIILFGLFLFDVNCELPVGPKGQVELPADDSPLDHEMIQWWYWTGFLTSDDNKLYGFEVCFFLGRPTYPQVVHTAVTDISLNKFTFDSVADLFDKPSNIPNTFNFSAGSSQYSNKVTGTGGNGTDSLYAEIGGAQGYKLDLKLESNKVPAIHYDGHAYNYPKEAGGGYTFYYSRTNMNVVGTLVLPNQEVKQVTGQAWFDRQFGSLIRVSLKGWQWFALSLSNGTEIMAFFSNDPNIDLLGVSITDSAGNTVEDETEVSLKVLDYWKSDRTGCEYPSGWELNVRGNLYKVMPFIKDQELGPTSDEQQPWVTPIYWEGANDVSDAITGENLGKAYVELNGFCPRV